MTATTNVVLQGGPPRADGRRRRGGEPGAGAGSRTGEEGIEEEEEDQSFGLALLEPPLSIWEPLIPMFK